MRTQTVVLAGLALVLAAKAARADIAGFYDVKYEQVSTNCQAPLNYPHGKLEVRVNGNSLIVDIDRTPKMVGIPAKNGKVSAKSKSGETMISGMQGVFSVAGRITPEGLLHFVMVGEYTAGGKPLCSQSWNINGPRSDSTPPKPEPKLTPKK